jgi:hypothetical protein
VDDEMLYLEPVPRHLRHHVHHDEHLPHLVVKKTEKDFQRENKVMFDTEGLSYCNGGLCSDSNSETILSQGESVPLSFFRRFLKGQN